MTGLPEPNPSYVRIEQGQVFVEVTEEPSGEQLVARLALPGAGLNSAWFVGLEFGCRVLLEYESGTTQQAVIVGRFNDFQCQIPAVAAGVQTGAAGAQAPLVGVPAPTWSFLVLPPGRLLAIETGVGGDILIHSGASVELKTLASGAVHANGRSVLGAGPLTPPVGSTVGPGGTEIPGAPAVPFVDTQVPTVVPRPPATIVPFVGTANAIIRQKDDVQSHIGVDPAFWAWVIAVSANPIVAAGLAAAGVTPPVALHSEHGGFTGPGSPHVALDSQGT